MASQLAKFLVLLNLCFWLTMAAQFISVAGKLPGEVVELVTVLGFSAIVFNVFYLIFVLFQKAGNGRRLLFYHLFIALSLIAQAIFLIPPFL